MTNTCIYCDAPAVRWCDFIIGYDGAPGELMRSVKETPIYRCDAPLCGEHAAFQHNMFFSGEKHFVASVDFCCSHDPSEDWFSPISSAQAEQLRIRHRRAARGLWVVGR